VDVGLPALGAAGGEKAYVSEKGHQEGG
jgi:hypothetical protein